MHGETRNVSKILVLKPDGKRDLGRRGCRLKSNFEVNLIEIGCGDADRIHFIRLRNEWRTLVNTVINFSGFIKNGGVS
jgi:hypothetical protein